MSVIEKLREADMCIWLDTVQYSHGGFTNRNRMPNGSWLTVPVERVTDMAPINRVRIADKPWRIKHAKTLWQHYGSASGPLIDEIGRNFGLLVGLNLACLRVIFEAAEIWTPWVFQSHLDGGSATIAVSESEEELRPISERLAMMVEEVGGDVYLSGPSGRRYLDEDPFHRRGIEVRYFKWDRSENPCSASLLRRMAVI